MHYKLDVKQPNFGLELEKKLKMQREKVINDLGF